MPLSPDIFLGHVDENGKVFEARTGPDRYVGRVALDSGKIYSARLGPEQHIAWVDLQTGKIYQPHQGPDEYLGRVRKNGQCYFHRSKGRDKYMGKIREMTSVAQGGAGFYFLLMPIFIDGQEKDEDNQEGVVAPVVPNGALTNQSEPNKT